MRKSKNCNIIFMIISIIAGLSLLIYPEKVHSLIIRLIGFLWILEGIEIILKLYNKKSLNDKSFNKET